MEKIISTKMEGQKEGSRYRAQLMSFYSNVCNQNRRVTLGLQTICSGKARESNMGLMLMVGCC